MTTTTDVSMETALKAARELNAAVEAQVRDAFDMGMDFVRSVDVQYSRDEAGETVSYQGAPWPPEDDTPAGFIRYARPSTWGQGK